MLSKEHDGAHELFKLIEKIWQVKTEIGAFDELAREEKGC